MSWKAFTGFVFAWMAVFILSLIADGAQGDTDCFNTVLQFELFTTGFSVFGFGVPLPNTAYFGCAMDLATWNSSLFSGVGQWIRWPLFLPLTGGCVFGFFTTLGPAINSAIGNLISAIRLIPFIGGS